MAEAHDAPPAGATLACTLPSKVLLDVIYEVNSSKLFFIYSSYLSNLSKWFIYI